MTSIGFLGPKGTFSHQAVNDYIKDKSGYEPAPFSTIPEIIYAVQKGEVDEGIVPIENSLEGAINATHDIMGVEVDLKIKAELVVDIKQNLLVKKGTKLENIQYILSHPQPIGQCRRYLSTYFPKAETVFVYSTSAAAQEVAEGNCDKAAIGSAIASEIYGLEIQAANIQDADDNSTRFVIISKEDTKKTGKDKTSIVFSTENKPGSLYRVLDIFNLWDINMTKIESRPAKKKLGTYIFFVDIEGHRDDDSVKDALTMVRKKTSFFKFLGSYPEYNIK